MRIQARADVSLTPQPADLRVSLATPRKFSFLCPIARHPAYGPTTLLRRSIRLFSIPSTVLLAQANFAISHTATKPSPSCQTR